MINFTFHSKLRYCLSNIALWFKFLLWNAKNEWIVSLTNFTFHSKLRYYDSKSQTVFWNVWWQINGRSSIQKLGNHFIIIQMERVRKSTIITFNCITIYVYLSKCHEFNLCPAIHFVWNSIFNITIFAGPSPPLNSTDDRANKQRNRMRKKHMQRETEGFYRDKGPGPQRPRKRQGGLSPYT